MFKTRGGGQKLFFFDNVKTLQIGRRGPIIIPDKMNL